MLGDLTGARRCRFRLLHSWNLPPCLNLEKKAFISLYYASSGAWKKALKKFRLPESFMFCPNKIWGNMALTLWHLCNYTSSGGRELNPSLNPNSFSCDRESSWRWDCTCTHPKTQAWSPVMAEVKQNLIVVSKEDSIFSQHESLDSASFPTLFTCHRFQGEPKVLFFFQVSYLWPILWYPSQTSRISHLSGTNLHCLVLAVNLKEVRLLTWLL